MKRFSRFIEHLKEELSFRSTSATAEDVKNVIEKSEADVARGISKMKGDEPIVKSSETKDELSDFKSTKGDATDSKNLADKVKGDTKLQKATLGIIIIVLFWSGEKDVSKILQMVNRRLDKLKGVSDKKQKEKFVQILEFIASIQDGGKLFFSDLSRYFKANGYDVSKTLTQWSNTPEAKKAKGNKNFRQVIREKLIKGEKLSSQEQKNRRGIEQNDLKQFAQKLELQF